MIRAMFTAASGMNAQQLNIDAIAGLMQSHRVNRDESHEHGGRTESKQIGGMEQCQMGNAKEDTVQIEQRPTGTPIIGRNDSVEDSAWPRSNPILKGEE